MNGEFENDWVLTGSAALKIIYNKYLESNPSSEILDFPVNDLDFLVYKRKNETIRSNYFGYQATADSLRSKTFIKSDAEFVKNFDLTYTHLRLSKIEIDGIPIINPNLLFEFYSDDLDATNSKLQIINNSQLLKFYKNYIKLKIPSIEIQDENENENDDSSNSSENKRLFWQFTRFNYNKS